VVASAVPDAPTDQRRDSAARLGRDVGVNVIANLIAAAIIYLLGVVAGLLPSSPAAIAAALGLLAGVSAIAMTGMLIVTALPTLTKSPKDSPPSPRTVRNTAFLSGGSAVLFGLMLALLPLSGTKPLDPVSWGFYFFGGMFIFTGCGLAYEGITSYKRADAGLPS
jgi:hypothetical protein